jgi:cob(I)alamin adenosyltransferase
MAGLASSLHIGSFLLMALIIHRILGLQVIIICMHPYYSRTGDDGYTSVLGFGRLPKHHPRLEAIGTIDEASAALGVARTLCQLTQTAELLITIQRDFYSLMAEVAALPENAARFRTIGAERVTWLEQQIDLISATIDLPGEFTISGNSPAGAALDLARTVVRRAERRLTELLHQGEIDNIYLIQYSNRASSLIYVLEGAENTAAGKNPELAKKRT